MISKKYRKTGWVKMTDEVEYFFLQINIRKKLNYFWMKAFSEFLGWEINVRCCQ
jgi:hypothetical protein